MGVYFADTGSPSKASPRSRGRPGTPNSVENIISSTFYPPLHLCTRIVP